MARPTDEAKTVRLDLRFTPSLIELIDEWRRTEDDIPPRAEAIRRLIMAGLDAEFMKDFVDKLGDTADDVLEGMGCTEDEIKWIKERGRSFWLKKLTCAPGDTIGNVYGGLSPHRPKGLPANNRHARRSKQAKDQP